MSLLADGQKLAIPRLTYFINWKVIEVNWKEMFMIVLFEDTWNWTDIGNNLENMTLEVSIKITDFDFITCSIFKDGLEIWVLVLDARRRALVAKFEAPCQDQHLSMPRIRLVDEASFVYADDPVEDSDLGVAIRCEAQSSLELNLKHFGKASFVLQEPFREGPML